MAKGKPIKVDNRVKKASVNSKWFQNVARSMGFTAADIVKDLMPNTSDFLEYNTADTMDMITDMRTNMSSRQMVNRQFKNIPQIKSVNNVLKNMKTDIKSGNLNNRSREQEFDFDDMDYGFGDWGDEPLEFIDEEEPKAEVKPNPPTVINTLPLAKMINASTEATVSTMVAVADQQMAIESEKLLFNHKSTSSILGGIGAINDNLSTLVRFNAESTAKYHAASIKFYEDMLEFTKKQSKSSGEKVAEDAVTSFNSGLYTYTGGVKISEYKKVIQDNLKEMRDENAMLASTFDALTDTSVLKGIAKNPVGTLMSIGMKSVIPVATKASLKAIDESLSSVIPAVMAKINTMDDHDNPIYNYIYKVFGSKNKLNYDVELDKYEKGVMSWDGECKKALVEVLPAHLRRIEAALTGQDERTFNYSTGRFSNSKTVKADYDKALTEVETSGYTNTKNRMRDIARKMKANEATMKQFEKDMDEYFAAMTKRGSLISPFKSKDKDGFEIDMFDDIGLFGGDPRRAQMMRNVMRGLSTKELTKMATMELYDSREKTQKYMDEIRKNPNISGYSTLFNGGYYDENGKLTYDATKRHGVTDKFGLSQLDYLRDIRSALINGIKVFPDTQKRYKNWVPNNEIIKREYQESKTSRGIGTFSSDNKINKKDYNYKDILSMTDDELNVAYTSALEPGPTDNKISRKIGSKFAKGNKILGSFASIVDTQVYKILFGEDIERATKARQGKSAIAGMASAPKGSLLSNITGFFTDTIKGVGAYFTGQPYIMSDGTKVEADPNSLMGKMKSFFVGTMDKLTEGSNGESKSGGIIGRVTQDFMDGFQQFKVSLFGEKKLGEVNTQETLKELMAKVKPRLPKAVGMGLGTAAVKTALASQMGLLGSILLPGGPLGAALIGTTVGFLKQSETFNKWLFGEKNEDGRRMGGFLPKSLVDSIEENGGAIKKGAGVGLLASFFLPGGPILGAITGIGAGMMSKSDAFQEFLYGKDFKEKDSRSMMNGAFGKLYKSTVGKAAGEGTNPKLAAFLGASGVGVGVAQGVGLLPSFLLPGGPVLGALLGLAGGITASSDKFQQMLFGEKDIDGKRYGGLMTKFTNWFDTSVVSPLKIKMTETNDKIYGFMKEKLFNPFLDAFEPIKQAGIFMLEDTKDAVKGMFNKITSPVVSSFQEHVTKPLGKALRTAVVDPLKRAINGTFSLLGKAIMGVVTSPMKLVTALGNKANAYNERHVMRKERKNRNQSFKDRLENEGFSIGKLFGGLTTQFIGEDEKEGILNEKLGYREARKRGDRKEALKAEMEARAAKRANMQKQFEEDMKFGKGTGWKYASQKQKTAREEELKQKTAWMQEKVAAETTEINTKITKINDLLKDTPKNETAKIDTLKEIKNLLKDNLRSLSDKASLSGVRDKLKEMGQSHKDGLEEVPKDGYIAELHEGEMVVPKQPAGLIRGMFGKKKSSGLGSIFGKLLGNDKKDRADNALGLSEDEEAQLKELTDIQRKNKVSRKSVDFMQNEMARKKKEKEEKKWKDDILNAVHGVGKTVAKGNSIADSIFGGITGFFKGLPRMLSGLLGALGLSGLGAMAAGALGFNALNEYSQIGEEVGADNPFDVAAGYGREERLDADGMYVYDNQTSSTLGKFAHRGTRKAFAKPIKVGYDKFGKPLKEQGKMVYDKAKPIAQKGIAAAKRGMTAVDNYINPKVQASGKSFLGTAYSYTGTAIDKSARKGIAKPVGAVVDTAKAVAKRSSKAMSTFIDMARAAMLLLEKKAVEKFPKLGSVAKNVDNVFQAILKNSDDIYRKFGTKISTFIADTALDVTPVGAVLEVCATAYDFISGFTKGNTGNLFGVPENQVDMEMRTITSFMQTLCGFSFMAIIWIINEITSSMMGLDFMQTIARTIYQALPLNFGRKIDLSNDLSGKTIDGMSLEDAIEKAGGDISQFIDENGKMKDITKLNADDLTGISAPEIMELGRLQYNQQNGTKMDSLAWKDMQSKTLGQKILGNKWVKNFKGAFQSQSIRGHMGLNKDAKLTIGDRTKFALGHLGVNMTNAFGKLIGNKQMQNLTTEKMFEDYEEKRTAKYKKKWEKADNANKKLKEKYTNTNNPIMKAFYNMQMGINKGKRRRAAEKIGTKKMPKSQRQKQIDAMKNNKPEPLSKSTNSGNLDKNAAGQDLLDVNDMYTDAYINKLTGPVAMGKGDGEETSDKKTIKKAVKNKTSKSKKNNTTDKVAETSSKITKSVNKSFNDLNKSVNKTGNVLKKGLDSGNKKVTKSFTDINKSLTKVAKSTKKTLDKDGKKVTKDLTKETKKMISSVKTSVKNITKKVNDAAKEIKNIKIRNISSISPTFTMDDPKKFFEDIIDKAFENSKRNDNNAGSSGIDGSSTRYSVKNNSDSGTFIQPSNNTTTNNNTNNNNKFVFYSQSDKKWAGTKIGNRTMADAGCGPTSIAMTISQMTGEEITPDTIAEMGKKELPGYSTYNLFPEIAKKFGMNYEDTNKANDIVRHLNDGTPVMLSGQGTNGVSPYTKDGHIVVANSIKGDKVFVTDPRGKNYSRTYKLSELMGGLKKAIIMKPTSATKNKLGISKGKIKGIKGNFKGSLNNEISNGDLSSKFLKENMGSDGQIKLYEKVLAYAKAFEKKLTYKYGSKGIDKNQLSSDCSGFTHHVFDRAAGIDIGAGSAAQHKAGTGVSYDQAQPADLIVFDGHAGIVWDSNKNMIDIGSGMGPVIRSYDTSYWKGRNPVIRRVLSDPNQMVSNTITNPNTALGITSVDGLNLGNIAGGAEASSGETAEVDPMGAFGKLGNIGQNMMASIFNGKQVDLFATSGGTEATVGGADISNISDVKQAVWKFFTSRGYTKEATAGIMGNLQQESGINPTTIQGNGRGPAAGIAQWENINKKSARWKQMSDYAASKGKDWKDLQSQLEFIEMELGGTGNVDKYTSTLLNKKVGGLSGFKSLTDVGKATAAFENSFERAGVKVMDRRIKYANNILSEMASAGMGPATATSAQAAPTDGTIPTSMNGWAYYAQTDPKWNNGKIGGTTIKAAGCGPTSHAMMLTSLFGQEITPETMTNWAHKNGTWYSGGMYHTMPDKVAQEFGLARPKTWTGKSAATLADIKSTIKAGHPVIMSGRGKSNDLNTPFTTGGHIVLGVGVDGSGNVIINDPRGPKYTKAYTDAGLTNYGVGLRAAWAFGDTSTKKIPTGLTVGGPWTGGSGAAASTTGGSAPEVDPMGVFGKLGNIGQNMMASIFNGKQVDLFATSGDTTGTTATGSGNFPKYNLNDSQIKGIANILQKEQPGPEGMQAEASLMANLTDMNGDHLATPENLVKKATGGWFAHGKSRFNNPGNPSETAINAVKSVLVNGRRTIPRYVNEHDMFGDLTSVSNNGSPINKKDRSAYKPHVTKIKNRYGSSGTFHSFPNSQSDPFYYTSEEMRKKWGENHYQPTGSAGMGDGKTYWAKGFGDNKPVKSQKVTYTGSMGKGDDTTKQYLNAKRTVEKTLRQMDRAASNAARGNENSSAMSQACMEVLGVIVNELQAINNNTANTAKGISEIEIVSSNEPVNSGNRPGSFNSKTNNSSLRQPNSNTGYDLARQIASYK